MSGSRLSPSLVASMLVIPLLLSLGVVLALRPIGVGWTMALRWMVNLTALPGEVAAHVIDLGPIFSFAVPVLSTPAGLPSMTEYAIVGGVSALCLVGSWLLPMRFLPLAYYLKFGVLVQLTAFLTFAIRPDAFPYALPPYVQSLFEIGAAVLVLVPVVYGCTLFPFDIALWRKVALVAATVVHLAVLIPLQVFMHAYTIHHLSLLAMPAMFFMWGVLIHVFVFVSFYGWGMSWPDKDQRANRPVREVTT